MEAAADLERAYEVAARTVINLPPYDELVGSWFHRKPARANAIYCAGNAARRRRAPCWVRRAVPATL